MTNAIHADEKQSREGLLFGLDRGRAACHLDCLRKRGSGLYWFRGFSGGGAAHKNIEAPQSMDGAMLESTFQVTSHQSLAPSLLHAHEKFLLDGDHAFRYCRRKDGRERDVW